MTAKVYIIDPDVWEGSIDDPRCHVAVKDVWERLQGKIALDSGNVAWEYVGLLRSRKLPEDLRKLLKDIFNQLERGDRIMILKPTYPSGLSDKISEWGCTTPVEPELIGMAADVSGAAMKLLLVGNDRLRPRGLHKKDVSKKLRAFFRENLNKGIGVLYASDIKLSDRDERVHAYERRLFEDQIRLLFMARIYNTYKQMPTSRHPTPGDVVNYSQEGKAGEIDVYLYVDVEETRYVWICECELREAGNEARITETEKVLKLKRKVEAARVFEQKEVKNVVVKGYMVTNTTGIHNEAEKIMRENDLQYCQVTMPENWENNCRWNITDSDISQFSL